MIEEESETCSGMAVTKTLLADADLDTELIFSDKIYNVIVFHVTSANL